MKIDQDEIDRIKHGIDLVPFMKACGIELTQVGGNYRGFCPFHEDSTPSLTVNPKENLWNCFGCDKGGDNIRFIQLFDKISFNEAVERLKGYFPGSKLPETTIKKTELVKVKKVPEELARELLQRTLTCYEQNCETEKLQNYLAQRGITDLAFLNRYAIGYSDGRLTSILPNEGGVLEDLTTLGILNDKGRERFTNCLVIPVYDIEGNLSTFYGRSVKQGDKRHIFLPNRSTGLWNVSILKTYSDIILVESILDGLSVAMAGFENVISCQGINGLSDSDINLLQEHGVTTITLLFDGDEPGRKAAERLKKKRTGIILDSKTLPDDHDPNSFLVEYGATKLAEFINAKPVATREKHEPSSPLTAPSGLQPTPEGFTISFGLRRYQVMGLERGPRKLKATVRLEHGGKIHADTLDFYSARARKYLAQDICRIMDELPESIDGDIIKLMSACEQVPEPAEQQDTKQLVELSAKEKKEAMAFGRSTDLIGIILSDFEICGLIGEESNKLLGYLAMTSRKLDAPLSLLILSSSGAGKTALQDSITAFCPPEDIVKITSLSGKALFYKDQYSLKNKVLAIEEGDGADDAAYAIRSLISNGVLITESTIKDLGSGRLTTMENRVEGPTSVFFTTTNPDTDPETASRFFVTGIDESREQTRKILAFQRKQQMTDNNSHNNQAEKVQHRHHNFQRLLQPVGVRNPYGDQLAYDDDRLQGRRDQPKYLRLIKAVAFLRQMQKKIHQGKSCFVEVDLEDIHIAGKLTNEILGKSLDELSHPGRDLLTLLEELVEQQADKLNNETEACEPSRTKISFTRRDIREFSGWANVRVHRYIKELIDLEYILVDSGRNGSAYRYRLAYEGQGKQGERFVLGLKDLQSLKKESTS